MTTRPFRAAATTPEKPSRVARASTVELRSLLGMSAPSAEGDCRSLLPQPAASAAIRIARPPGQPLRRWNRWFDVALNSNTGRTWSAGFRVVSSMSGGERPLGRAYEDPRPPRAPGLGAFQDESATRSYRRLVGDLGYVLVPLAALPWVLHLSVPLRNEARRAAPLRTGVREGRARWAECGCGALVPRAAAAAGVGQTAACTENGGRRVADSARDQDGVLARHRQHLFGGGCYGGAVKAG